MEDKHKEVIQTFERDYTYHEDQRDQANEDIRFIVSTGGQWEGFLEEAYENRPKMEFDKVSQSINRFMGEWAANEVVPKFRDEDNSDEVDDSELAEGLFRARFRKEGGKISTKNAVFEVAAGGMGAIRLGTRYLDEYNIEDSRQEVTFSPIQSACTSVVFDSNAQQMDKRDARHVSVIWEYTRSAFEAKWPESEAVSATTKDDRRQFNWVSKDTIFVIEFYEVIEKRTTAYLFMNDLGDRYELDAEEYDFGKQELLLMGYREISHRKVKRRHIEKSILSGQTYLEKPRRIAGKILPIIPFYGYWAWVDGQEQYWGLVRKEKDPQRVLNMNVSNLAELASMSPKEAPIFDPSQVKGLHTRWAEAHLGKKNFHLARALRDKQGNIIQTGPIGTLKPPAIDPATQGLIQFTTDHIRSTSGGMPQDVEDPDASGKAILAVQKRVDMDTYTIMDNIGAAMCRMGECFVSIAQEIYKDKRSALSIAEDGSESKVKLNQVKLQDGQIKTLNSLSGKRFEVYTTVGPSYESKRRETVELLKEVISVLPENDPRLSAVISSIIENVDGPGLDVVKNLNRKLMLSQGLVEPKDDKEKELLAQISQQNNQPDGMQELIKSQTALNFAEAQGQQATNVDKMASAEKKKAEAAKIIESIGVDKLKLFLDALDKEQKQLTH